MKRKHAIAISLLLAVAVLAGGVAATRTTGFGSSAKATAVSDQTVAAKKAALDKYEASLKEALAKKPPKLPPLAKPKVSKAGPSPAAPQVIYVSAPQPASAGRSGDDGSEHENGDGGEHEGGGADD